MRGDFSAWNKDRSRNFRGTLHQQGRVLLDRDWNAQTEVFGEWQETAARDAFGPGVAAVPAEEPLSFKITKAAKVGPAPEHVEVSVTKGHIWADGLLVELNNDADRTATYLQPPIQDPAGKVSDLPANIRDAVILETWLQELSPFQDPGTLLEPALGGVDTTERVQTAYRFRLYRMKAGDTCDSIIPKLDPDLSNVKGKLTVDLVPTTQVDGDCPVVEEGGYTGFEHRLYRIEIAETDRANQSYFKWSHFNGGLVGTGNFDSVNKKVVLVGNRNAIVNSGLNKFYLEALDFDEKLGCWQVIYGARVTLAADNTLTLPAAPSSEIFIGSAGLAEAKPSRFFRLWNGIERVDDFKVQKELPDLLGIRVEFEAEAAKKYIPSDYWTFEVRISSNEFSNPQMLVNDQLPQGVFYHRVPLAEVTWTGNTVTGDDIEDCRRIFQPLTKLRGCCTYRVGDGVHSHGDFKSIQAAIDALPKAGGEVCVLPGIYKEQVLLTNRTNVILKGCDRRSIIRPEEEMDAIVVSGCRNIRIESLVIETKGIGVNLNGDEKKPLINIELSSLFVTVAGKSAILGHDILGLSLRTSTVYIEDSILTFTPGVYLAGNDMLIERNEIRVLSKGPVSVRGANIPSNDPQTFVPAKFAFGGLQIGGGSERVRILDNLIIGGRGNGITLGSIDKVKDGNIIKWHFPWVPKKDPADTCDPPLDQVDDDDVDEDGLKPVAGPRLVDIFIEFNRIFNMGRNGIGVAAFFVLRSKIDPSVLEMKRPVLPLLISVRRLAIIENRIEFCVYIKREEVPLKLLSWVGSGGIALAHVEDLVIWDNFIIGNGPDFNEAVCGIFILYAEGLDISRNHILGPRNGVSVLGPANGNAALKQGPRGGIWIKNALTPFQYPPVATAVPAFPQGNTAGVPAPQAGSGTPAPQGQPVLTLLRDSVEVEAEAAAAGPQAALAANNPQAGLAPAGTQGFVVIDQAQPAPPELRTISVSTGRPTAVIRENIVSVQAGRSLTIYASGSVSVTDNEFTTYGPAVFSLYERLNGSFSSQPPEPFVYQLADRVAGNVLISDISFSDPLGFLLIELFGSMVPPSELGRRVAFLEHPAVLGQKFAGGSASLSIQNGVLTPPPAPRFTDRRFLFANNQCHQDNMAVLGELPISSIAVFSPNDSAFSNNQSTCRPIKSFLRDSLTINFPITHAHLYGLRTARTNDNRLTEPIEDPLHELGSMFSAFIVGELSIVLGNIASHCIAALGRRLEVHPDLPRVIGGTVINFIEIEEKFDRNCEKSNIRIGGTLEPKRTLDTLSDLQAVQMGERLRLRYEKRLVYRRELERATLIYGDKHLHTEMLKDFIKFDAVEIEFLAMEYAAAATPLTVPPINGWVIDGFVRFQGSGLPAFNVQVGAYESANPAKKVFGDTTASDTGYFRLTAPAGTPVPQLVLRVMKDNKFLDTNDVTLFPILNECTRVEITVDDIDGFTSLTGGGGVGGGDLSFQPAAAPTAVTASVRPAAANEGLEAEDSSAARVTTETAKKPAAKKAPADAKKPGPATKPAAKAPAKKPAKAEKPARPKKRG